MLRQFVAGQGASMGWLFLLGPVCTVKLIDLTTTTATDYNIAVDTDDEAQSKLFVPSGARGSAFDPPYVCVA